ncbi:GGDEF domain-containing protein [Xanthobacteraceae bacterium A53D]
MQTGTMGLDHSTMFSALIVTMLVSGASLLWSWSRDRSETMLAWCGGGLLLTSFGIALFSAKISISPGLHYRLGPAALILGLSAVWAGARAFNRSSIPWLTMGLLPAGWLLFSLSPDFDTHLALRSIMGSLFIATPLLLAGAEFRRGEPLAGRMPLAILCGVHGVFVLLRVPVILELVPDGMAPMQSQWMGVALIEPMVMVQMTAILLIALTKERLEMRLRLAAQTDALTGLYNRRAFFEMGAARMAACAKAGKPVAVVIFDLDGFKAVNDTYGHATGDAVLRAFAAAVNQDTPGKAVAARIGGEEFALILPCCAADQAILLCERLMARFTRQALLANGMGLHCTTSGGIAVSADGSGTVEELLGQADHALYAAKREGENILRLAPSPAAPAAA